MGGKGMSMLGLGLDDEPRNVTFTQGDFVLLMTEKIDSIPYVIARVEAEFGGATSAALNAGARNLIRALRQQERALRFSRDHLGEGPWHVTGAGAQKILNGLRAYDEGDIEANLKAARQGYDPALPGGGVLGGLS